MKYLVNCLSFGQKETQQDLFLTENYLPEPHEAVKSNNCVENSSPIKVRKAVEYDNSLPYLDNEKTSVLIRRVFNRDQLVVPESMQSIILDLSHSPVTSRHTGERKMYATMRRFYYCTSIELDCVHYEHNCETCARERIQLRRYEKSLRLFTDSRTLEK